MNIWNEITGICNRHRQNNEPMLLLIFSTKIHQTTHPITLASFANSKVSKNIAQVTSTEHMPLMNDEKTAYICWNVNNDVCVCVVYLYTQFLPSSFPETKWHSFFGEVSYETRHVIHVRSSLCDCRLKHSAHRRRKQRDRDAGSQLSWMLFT